MKITVLDAADTVGISHIPAGAFFKHVRQDHLYFKLENGYVVQLEPPYGSVVHPSSFNDVKYVAVDIQEVILKVRD